MNTTTKTIATASLATLLSVIAVAGVTAADSVSERQSGLIDKISTEHNIDRTELESTFESYREERKAQHAAEREAHLQSLVDDGTITAEQKDALIAKKSEMKDAMMALKDSEASREEIKELMIQARDDFKSWAEEQGIDLEQIRPEDGPRKGHGKKGLFRSSSEVTTVES